MAQGAVRVPAEEPGVVAGLIIGVLARNGRDKVTVIASPACGPGGPAEQLLAESTGKDARRIL